MTAYRVVAPSLDVTSIQFTSIRTAPYRKQNCISVPACVTLPYREKMERREKVAAFFARSYFSTCVLLSFSFLSRSLQWFLSSVRTIFLLFFWLLCSHPWYSFGHINISIPPHPSVVRRKEIERWDRTDDVSLYRRQGRSFQRAKLSKLFMETPDKTTVFRTCVWKRR